jgi:hypothetical protein
MRRTTLRPGVRSQQQHCGDGETDSVGVNRDRETVNHTGFPELSHTRIGRGSRHSCCPAQLGDGRPRVGLQGAEKSQIDVVDRNVRHDFLLGVDDAALDVSDIVAYFRVKQSDIMR